jgi:endogenous inhibitor of DNA gyrase (YacG/DUF329 family)
MTLCEQCLKPITGTYFYSKEKNDDKKFCSQYCMNDHYGFKCAECGKVLAIALDKDGKKFCSTACQNKHFGDKYQEKASDFWAKYKGYIIGGGVFLLFLK